MKVSTEYQVMGIKPKHIVNPQKLQSHKTNRIDVGKILIAIFSSNLPCFFFDGDICLDYVLAGFLYSI
ncbi:hypothetical protein V3F56_09090 [Moorellaceae bacterium AZ2]